MKTNKTLTKLLLSVLIMITSLSVTALPLKAEDNLVNVRVTVIPGDDGNYIGKVYVEHSVTNEDGTEQWWERLTEDDYNLSFQVTEGEQFVIYASPSSERVYIQHVLDGDGNETGTYITADSKANNDYYVYLEMDTSIYLQSGITFRGYNNTADEFREIINDIFSYSYSSGAGYSEVVENGDFVDITIGSVEPGQEIQLSINPDVIEESLGKFTFDGWYKVENSFINDYSNGIDVGKGVKISDEYSLNIMADDEDNSFLYIAVIEKYMSSEGDAYAVLTDNGELVFCRSYNSYANKVRQTVVDIHGMQYTGIVYSGFEEVGDIGESHVWDWITVNGNYSVGESFVAENTTIKPSGYMDDWFFNYKNLVSFDGAGFDTSTVKDMSAMFSDCVVLTSVDLSSFDTHNVVGMSSMFANCRSLKSIDLGGFDTSNVTGMSAMFYGCSSLEELDLSSFNTRNVQYMGYLFEECNSLTSLDISNFDTGSVISMIDMFSGCDSLKSIKIGKNFTKWIDDAYLPAGIWTNGTIIKTETELYNEYPEHASEWAGTWTRTIPVSQINIDKTEITMIVGDNEQLNATILPESATNKEILWSSNNEDVVSVNQNGLLTALSAGTATIEAKTIDGTELSAKCTVKVVTDSSCLGKAYAVLTDDGDLIFFRSSNTYTGTDTTVTDIYGKQFSGKVFTGVENGVRGWCTNDNIAKVKKVYVAENTTITPISMDSWFYDCSNLVSFSGKGFNTSNVTDMRYMFYNCSSLTSLELSEFNTSNVTNMNSMFFLCNSLSSLDLNTWDTYKVTDMQFMFQQCYHLSFLDISSFSTNSNTKMNSMFRRCDLLKEIKLGNKFSAWNDSAYLPKEKWSNGILTLSYSELYDQYPSNAQEWAGVWKREIIQITDFELSIATMHPLEFTTINRFVEPLNATIQVFEWSSSNETVATVDEEGSVRAISSGETIITATTTDGSNISRSILVRVVDSYAYAVLTDEGDLIFFRSKDIYSNIIDATVVDINGQSLSGTIFVNVEELYSEFPDKYKTKVKRIYVADNTTIYMNTMHWFSRCSNLVSFNGKGFDTSNVTYMGDLFLGCKSLTSIDLSSFNTSNVTNMAGMFCGCSSLVNLDLSSFDTRNVVSMYGMFGNSSPSTFNVFPGCTALKNLELGDIVTSNVTDTSYMFSGCSSLTEIDLSRFNTSNITNMSSMFFDCNSLTSIDLSSFDTQNVTSMSNMFGSCSCLTSLDLSKFDTSKVIYMSGMFSGCGSLTSLDLSSFDTDNVTYMSNMFSGCSSLKSIDLNNFNTGNDTDMSGMFYNCSTLTYLDLTKLDTSNVTNMYGIFEQCDLLQEVKLGLPFEWNSNAYLPAGTWTNGTLQYTEKELYERYSVAPESFRGIWKRTLNLVTDLELKPLSVLHLGESASIKFQITPYNASAPQLSWTSSNEKVIKVDQNGNVSAIGVGEASITARTKDGSNLSDSIVIRIMDSYAYAVLDDDGTFVFIRSKENYSNGDYISPGVFRKVIDINGNEYIGTVFSDVEKLYMDDYQPYPWYSNSKIKRVYVAENTTIYPASMFCWFADCENLQTFNGIGIDTSNVTDMRDLFRGCKSLTELDLSNFNTGRVTDVFYMDGMFSNCSSLTRIDLSHFDTSSITNMHSMFSGCSSLTSLDLRNFNTSNVTSMDYMFNECSSLTSLDLSNFDTSNVMYMCYMFNDCSSLISINVRGFDTGSVTNYDYMFNNCSSLTSLDIRTFNTRNVDYEGMEFMFGHCDALETVDLGTEFTKWEPLASELPEGKWTNGVVIMQYPSDLVREYPQHAKEWAGTWYRIIKTIQTISLDKNSLILDIGEKEQLSFSTTPKDASYTKVKWESSNPNVAIVDENGVVTAISNGRSIITAKTLDGSNLEVKCVVSVGIPTVDGVIRIAGLDRFETSQDISLMFKQNNDVDRLDTVILANGGNFADALAGSYLAAVKNAPIIITKAGKEAEVNTYIRSILNKNGTIYVLGGTAAVPESCLNGLTGRGYEIKRLWGETRYLTNLEILKEAGVEGDTLLIATGTNYADSLSASATGLPMLLVKDSLSDEQRSFLREHRGMKLIILGGTSAVNTTVETQLNNYGDVSRIYGANRGETSLEIAKRFFPEADTAVIAYSHNFPDGLCGGPLAHRINAPLILTRDNDSEMTASYMKSKGIRKGYVLGGTAVLTDSLVRKLYGMRSSDKIIEFNK